MAVYPTVGVIWNPRSYNPPFTQPGGPGTAVFPAQSVGELLGQWMAGCGMSFNNFLVEAATGASGHQVAVVMCPLCRYTQLVIDPFDAIYSFPYEIIMA